MNQTPEPLDNPEPADKSKQSNSVAKSAGIVSIAVLFSRFFGLIRETVFARMFGTGFLLDAYFVGFRVPNMLRDLFAEGALSVAFVKVFTDYQENVGEKEAWRLAALTFNLISIVLSAVVIAGILLAPFFIPYLAAGFSPEKAQLAITLTQIMFPFILIVALSAVAMGVLNTKGHFGIPASASTAFNIFSILAGVGLAYYFSGGGWVNPKDVAGIPEMPAQWAITGMAVGTLIGGLAQLGIQIPSLYKVGFRFKPIFNFSDPGIKRVMRLMGPAIIGTSAVQVKVMVDTFMVSGIEGGNSWLPLSFRLMQFPIGLFGVAIGVASLPTLARLGSKNDISGFRSTLSNALGLVFLMTIPSACGLIVLGEPIVRLIYQGGAFTAIDTNMTAWALAAYSVGLVAYAAIKVLSPSFYALEDAKTPMYISLASILIHVGCSYGLLTLFSTISVTPETPSGYGHVGVALATSIVATVNFLALTFFMRRKIKRIDARKIISSFVRIAAASALMSLVCWVSYRYLDSLFAVKHFSVNLLDALVPIMLGGLTFAAAAKILRVSEVEQLIKIFRRKFGRA